MRMREGGHFCPLADHAGYRTGGRMNESWSELDSRLGMVDASETTLLRQKQAAPGLVPLT